MVAWRGQARRRARGDKAAPARARPRTAYVLFMMATRPLVAQQHPTYTFGEVGRVVGARWRALSANERAPYERLAAAERAAWSRARAPTPP
jgi:hypothetical protein